MHVEQTEQTSSSNANLHLVVAIRAFLSNAFHANLKGEALSCTDGLRFAGEEHVQHVQFVGSEEIRVGEEAAAHLFEAETSEQDKGKFAVAVANW